MPGSTEAIVRVSIREKAARKDARASLSADFFS